MHIARSWGLSLALGLVLVCSSASPLSAQQLGAEQLQLDEDLPTESYSRWVLLVDGITVGVLASAAGAGLWCFGANFESHGTGDYTPCYISAALAAAGGLGFFIAPFVVHAQHDQWGRAWLSLGLRVGLPLTALLALALMPAVAIAAVPIAFAVAVGLDCAVLARRRVRPQPERGASLAATGAGLGLRVVF